MADLQKRTLANGDTRWDVRYRDKERRQRRRSFRRKVDAHRFANEVETDLVRGDWIDPDHGRQTFGSWADKWLLTLGDKKPKTSESYESIVRKHLVPRFGSSPISSIDYPTVLAFVAELQGQPLGNGTVRNIRDVLRLIMQLAVRSGAIKANPVQDVKVAKPRHNEMHFLDADQIVALAREVSRPPIRYRNGERRVGGYPEYGLLIRFAAFTGLRAGELVALRPKNVDLVRRRVNVRESASEAHGQLQFVDTKTYEHRSVPIPPSFLEELTLHLHGVGPGDFVFRSPQGGPLRYGNWFKRHFKPAAVRAGLPEDLRFHDLRH